ncbi:MAG: class I SAM-dependent methyltransferase [Saprospiraceae bacterium]|nr:class I SAM-dependent methyltransferase [Saprospiraceae bacterium]
MSARYVHGYDATEQERLLLQAGFLENMVHASLDLSAVNRLLEVGCGVGAQTLILLKKYPHLKITAIDREWKQIEKAKQNLKPYPEFEHRVEFLQADIHNFNPDRLYDGIYFCWVLEHVHSPKNVLAASKKLLQHGGQIFASEVFHPSFYIYPENEYIKQFWDAFADLQRDMDGDPDIGVKLGSYLFDLGFTDINTYNIGQYWDKRHPKERAVFVDYFKDLTFTAKDALLESEMIDLNLVERTAHAFDSLRDDEDAIIYYRGFQATAKHVVL